MQRICDYFLLPAIFVLAAGAIIAPVSFAYAADPPQCTSEQVESSRGGIVPCGKACDDPRTAKINEAENCNFCHFFYLLSNIFDFILKRAAPALALLAVAGGGFLFATSPGNPASLSAAKNLILFAVAGYALVFLGWMLANSFFSLFGIKKWTGLVPETGIVSSVRDQGKTICDDTKTWGDNQWANIALTITESANPQLAGEIGIVESNRQECLTLKNALVPTPVQGDKYRIAGWWHFTCLPVTPPAAPPPATLTLSVSPSTIVEGEQTTLSWNATHMTNTAVCSAFDAWSGRKLLTCTGANCSGSETITPALQPGSHTFTLVCTDQSIVRSASAQLLVNQRPGSTLTPHTSLPPMPNPVPNQWTQFSNNEGKSDPRRAQWTQKIKHASVVFNDPQDSNRAKIWIIGGYSEQAEDAVWLFDGLAWKPGIKLPAHRANHAVVVFRNKIWVIGGTDLFNNPAANSWAFNPASPVDQAWEQKTIFPARYNHAAVVLGDKIWIIGGQGSVLGKQNQVWSCDGSTCSWEGSKDFPEVGAEQGLVDHMAVAFDNKIWVMGGLYTKNQVWSFNPAAAGTETNPYWVRPPHDIPGGGITHGHAALVHPDGANDKIWLIGGYEDETAERFWQVGNNVRTFDGSNWAIKPALPIDQTLGMAEHTAVIYKDPRDDTDKIWIIGGYGKNRVSTRDLWVYTPPATAGSQPAAKRVFVTNSDYHAVFFDSSVDPPLTSIAAADAACQALAPQGTTFKAWLSDGTPSGDPNSRFSKHTAGPYVLMDSPPTTIAKNWDGLVDGYLMNPINKTENGSPLPDANTKYAWTAMDFFGRAHFNREYCENWSSDTTGSILGPEVGKINAKDKFWSEGGTNVRCASRRHLYCFEQ